jgi:hypothetical protein
MPTLIIDGKEKTPGMSHLSLWTVSPSNVPAPAAVWLLGTGLVGLIGVRRKMKK